MVIEETHTIAIRNAEKRLLDAGWNESRFVLRCYSIDLLEIFHHNGYDIYRGRKLLIDLTTNIFESLNRFCHFEIYWNTDHWTRRKSLYPTASADENETERKWVAIIVSGIRGVETSLLNLWV